MKPGIWGVRACIIVAAATMVLCAPPYHDPLPLEKWRLISPDYFEYDRNYCIGEPAPDSTYGLSPAMPVPTAYFTDSVIHRGLPAEQFYLSHLLCPGGSIPRYYRVASCCTSTTLTGEIVALDVFKVRCPKSGTRYTVYLDGNRQGLVYAPIGLLLYK